MFRCMTPTARFDDASPGPGGAFELTGLETTVVARRLDEVRPALDEVEGHVAAGRWVAGYVAYDAAPGLVPRLQARGRDEDEPFGHLPLVWFGVFRDRERSEPFEVRTNHPAPYNVSSWRPTEDRRHYEAAVRSVHQHVVGGDIEQANYSTRLRAAFSGDPFEFYRDLVIAQRSGHCGYLDTGRFQVLSASPERFYQRTGDSIRTRPMKGTTRRGRWLEEDRQLARMLSASERERGEHDRVVAAIAADLATIAHEGKVMVSRPYELERYETVWQLTSTVETVAAPDATCARLFSALFPAVSIAGVPRDRTMALIAEVEHTSRGLYCGAVGFMGANDGRTVSSFNVAIRTVLVDSVEGMAEYGTGGGVSLDSAAAAEFAEARTKAQLLVERRPAFDLLEVLRWDAQDGYWWPEEHLDRLQASAIYFGFPFDRDEAEGSLAETARDLAAPSEVTLVLQRDGAIRTATARLEGPMAKARRDGPLEYAGPIRPLPVVVEIDDEPVASSNVFLFHKTTWRREYDHRLAKHPGAGEVVMCNERGEITEGTGTNVVAMIDGTWWTPPLDSGCMPGVYRRVLLEAGVIKERSLSVSELVDAEDIALISSLAGWRPATLAADPWRNVAG
jgi:para-aminobenzoate synthetase / 4-amino-4-deoxychorismate lyase